MTAFLQCRGISGSARWTRGNVDEDTEYEESLSLFAFAWSGVYWVNFLQPLTG
jgi:hypothetical protein